MVNKHPLVSIIVPVYNVENYIGACIESVLSQSYSNWELLLINDGSMDESGVVCNEYQERESRIKVFHKENAGVSCARNTGLDIAVGKYVIFLDADDYWHDSFFLERFVSIAESNGLDVLRGEYKAVDPEGNDMWCPIISQEKIHLANQIVDSATFIKNAIDREYFLVLSLFRREVIDGIRLHPGQIFLEDMRFYAMLLSRPLKCMYVLHNYYAYRKNISSVSDSINIKKLEDSFGMCEFFHDYAQRVASAELLKHYNYYSVMMYRWTLETLSMDGYYEERKQLINSLKLRELRVKVCTWIKEEHIRVNGCSFYVPPIIGVIYFRIRNNFMAILYRIKNSIV